MLKAVDDKTAVAASIRIGDAQSLSPFSCGLEYCPPARGTWNIVHTGMLIPEVHEIFVCAAGCLRGVVLTAAEMGAIERFSTVAVEEHNVLDGSMEELIIEGVTEILHRLAKLPPAVLVYTSCIHQFMGCDLARVYRILRERFPKVLFTDCYMNPIMRKSGATPDMLMRKQLYSFLEPTEKDAASINIIGNDLPTEKTSDFYRMITENGFTLRDITSCRSFSDYREMSKAPLNVVVNPSALLGAKTLEARLGQRYVYLPQTFGFDETERLLRGFALALGVTAPDFIKARGEADNALKAAAGALGKTPVTIDYTAVFRPLGLARLLLSYGVNVTCVFADGFSSEEQENFDELKRHYPQLLLHSASSPLIRTMERGDGKKTVAIGQKAAYYTGTEHFVNIVEGGGMHGFDGIRRMAELITEALYVKKDTRGLIQIKGMGCGCCQ